MKVKNLSPHSKRVDTVVKVVSKGPSRRVTSRRNYTTHRVAEALVGDETGSIYLTLWDDTIEGIDMGDTITIRNGYVKLFRGSMRLNIGRYGTFKTVEESPISEVNTENNLSDKRYRRKSFFPHGYNRVGWSYGRTG